jgi:hypothetical protein
MPKLIYLDSNDFSNLSEPEERLSETDKRILEALRNAHTRGDAAFYISPVHISEAVHASAAYKDAAVRRAALMRELAGTNILRFPYEICKIELTKALSGQESIKCSIEEIASKPNEWFGTVPESNLDERRKEIDQMIEQALSGRPRAERRRLKSELNPARKSSHSLIRSLVNDGLRNAPPTTLPISLLNPGLALDWYLGIASDAEFRSNSVRLLNDPYLLFEHLIDEVGQRGQLHDLLRDQGLKWRNLIESGMSEMAPLYAFAHMNGEQIEPKSLVSRITTPVFWQKMIGTLADRDLSGVDSRELIEAKNASPSTAIFFHSLLQSVLVKLQSTRSRAIAGNLSSPEVKLSDYGDFMHAI